MKAILCSQIICNNYYSKDSSIRSNGKNTLYFCYNEYHNILNNFIHVRYDVMKNALLDSLRETLLKEIKKNKDQQNLSHSTQEANGCREASNNVLQYNSDCSVDLSQNRHKPTETCKLIYSEAFWVACYSGNLKLAILLSLMAKEYGVEIRALGSNGWTPFVAACSMGHTQVARHIIENDYFENVDESSRQGNTALLLAIWNGQNFGLTALHLAVEKNDITAVKQLVYIINVDEQDNLGRTALYMAACFGHVEIFRILYSAFADENIADNKGETARHIAMKNGNDDITDILDCKTQNLTKSDNPIISEEGSLEPVNVPVPSATGDETTTYSLYKTFSKNNMSQKNVGFLIATEIVEIFTKISSIVKKIMLPIIYIIANVNFKVHDKMKTNATYVLK